MRLPGMLAYLFVLLLALLLASCQPASTPTPVIQPATPIPSTSTPAPSPTLSPTATYNPDWPRYGQDGPYAVEMQNLSIQDGDHKVNIAVWYPAVNGAPDTAHGPYPLVVFSPGLGMERRSYDSTVRPIAAYGFVMISWTPRGETDREFWAGAATRPLDTLLIIHYADKLTAPGGELAGLIDTRHIAVAGHSSGGWTALVGGGAQMDLGWCAAHLDLVYQNPLSNCGQFDLYQDQISAMLGLSSTPAGLWPQIYDPRVAAVIAMSPDGDIWGADYGGVASLKVPTLIMAGGLDSINDPKYCAFPIYEHLGSSKKSMVVFENGAHDLGWVTYSPVIKHIMTAFLLAELKGDPEAVKVLSPANAIFPKFPGITYQTTEFKSE